MVLVINSLSGTGFWYAERWSSRQGLNVTEIRGSCGSLFFEGTGLGCVLDRNNG